MGNQKSNTIATRKHVSLSIFHEKEVQSGSSRVSEMKFTLDSRVKLENGNIRFKFAGSDFESSILFKYIPSSEDSKSEPPN